MTLLADPERLPTAVLPSGLPLLPSTPIPQSRQPCMALSEPLVPIDLVDVLDAYAVLGILPARRLLLRQGTGDRLKIAQSNLPRDFSLVVLDGWRTLDEQRALLHYYATSGPTDGFVASLSAESIRPPHTTGGAVDLTLAWEGVPLALGTDFDCFRGAARLQAFEHSDSTVRRLRRLLASVLIAAGLVPYELEWWHWSYGDDVWAATTRSATLYDVKETAV